MRYAAVTQRRNIGRGAVAILGWFRNRANHNCLAHRSWHELVLAGLYPFVKLKAASEQRRRVEIGGVKSALDFLPEFLHEQVSRQDRQTRAAPSEGRCRRGPRLSVQR